ncbi:MAG: Ig-like domain-containing protein [Segetibacter sp.]
MESGSQDILNNLELTFSQPIKTFDTTKIILAAKDFTPVNNYTIVADTNKTRFLIVYSWPTNTDFNLLISKDAFTDSAGLTLAKNDTIKFSTKRNEDYGSVRA